MRDSALKLAPGAGLLCARHQVGNELMRDSALKLHNLPVVVYDHLGWK